MVMKRKRRGKDLSLATGKPMIETCHLGNPNKLFEKHAIDETSYIHEHLSTLYFIVKEFNCKQILEIGTGPGDSLITMAEAGGHVTTIDIEECSKAKDLAVRYNLQNNITFVRGNSDRLELRGKFDLILIDGGHTYNQVLVDARNFAEMVKKGGFMIFHDSTNPAWSGVKRAIHEFQDDYIHWRRYDWFNCNGLVVFKYENN